MNTLPVWDYPQPFVIAATVAESQQDTLGHTNNAVYVNWCEQVAWRHSESLGLGIAEYRQLNRAMVIRRSEYDYLAASHTGDAIQIATWITGSDGRLQLERRFQIVREQDQVTLLRARMQFACVELSSGRPRRMPETFVQAYGSLITEARG